MTITKSLVEKIQITNAAQNIYSISAFFEDFGKNQGKVTIECDGDAWSYFWSATARSSIKEFFLEAGTDYLVGKFHRGISRTITDDSQESLQQAAKQFILAERRNEEISKQEAYFKWEHMDVIDDRGADSNADSLYYIFGDEWYYQLPQKPNQEYNHLCQIVSLVKEAIRGCTPNSLS